MSLRALLAADSTTLGHLVFEFATPGIGYMIRNAGADFAIFDLEHNAASFETAKLVVLSARAAGLPLVVRVPSRDTKDLARACDIGADGVMAPLVSSAEEAREIVAAIRYFPEGRRGIGQLQMHDQYRIGAFAPKAAAANAGVAIILQIESRDGVSASDAIAAVPGVDCLWIGHMDLSCSLGAPGDFATPEFVEATRTVVQGALRHGKKAGRVARNAEEGAALHAQGFRCLALSTDTQVYQSALATGLSALRSALPA
jgi:4-hydroxy-2-oxoheptanedioate aldolase